MRPFLEGLFSRRASRRCGSDEPLAAGDAELVRAAFPLPEASAELRRRVAAICREAAARGGSPRGRLHPALALGQCCRLALGATLLLLIVVALLGGRERGGAYASETAGRLIILDRNGRQAGLCPLERTDVAARIEGFVARVTVTQRFRNPSTTPIEAVYTFPLPEDAAVDDMTMSVGERVIRGEIRRREEALEIYEAAKQEGKTAALLDQDRPNIFTQSVANIMPGENVTVTIRYVNQLKYDSGEYEFVYPMVVGPRYIPGGGYTVPGRRGAPAPGSAVPDAERITPPITPPARRAGHNISVTVELDAGLPVREVTSKLHPVQVEEHDPQRRTVRLEERDELPNRDFILRYRVAGEALQTGLVARAGPDGGGTFALIVQPPQVPDPKEVAPKEIVFVIDQSGSQSGWPIQKAKETMRYLVRNMNPGDTFQLLGFNLQVNACFPGPVHNTPENVARALEFLEPIEGSGGTDILKAVDYALRIPDDSGRRRIVCYLTDGYVGDDMRILGFVRENRRRAHMFPFGIGNSVNRFLIEGIAREGQGTPEYVTLQSNAEEAAARFYRRISKPLLVGMEVDWNDLPVSDVYPQRMPDLFVAGRPIILKGRYARAAEGEIRLRGELDGQRWSHSIRVALPKAADPESPLPSLWAREKIEALQSGDWAGVQSGNPDPETTEQIIRLALDYRLMTQHTSFVAVEQRLVNVQGKPRRVDVPVEMPEGISYQGIFGEDSGITVQGQSVRPDSERGASLSRVHHSLENYKDNWGVYPQAPAPSHTPGNPGARPIPRLAPSADPPPSGLGGYAAMRGGAPTSDPKTKRRNGANLLFSDGHTRMLRQPGYVTQHGPGWRAGARGEQSSPRHLAQAGAEKLAPELAQKARLARQRQSQQQRQAPEPVEIQIWLSDPPRDALEKLKALGFELAATLTPSRLLLGTVPLEKLEALAKLEFVRRIEPPRFR